MKHKEEKIESHLIGRFGNPGTGPAIICLGGIHGDEKAGVHAIESVLNEIDQLDLSSFFGELIGLKGNISALEKDIRFIDRDFNRSWDIKNINKILSGGMTHLVSEDLEMIELYNEVKSIIQNAKGHPVFFLDLHTSTAKGSPFICFGDTIPNRNFAMKFPVPIILGLEEHLNKPLIEFMTELGCISMAVEGGQHHDVSSMQNLVSIIWLALTHANMINRREILGINSHIARLQKAVNGLPMITEIKFRHEISPDDRFIMKSGYKNFQPIFPGEQIASDKSGAIKANILGRIILPLYQGLGNDGFFVGKEIKPFWFSVSVLLRKFRLDNLLPLFPGIRKSLDQKHTFILNKKLAKWLGFNFFHLFGYRLIPNTGQEILIKKRVHGNKITF